MLELRKLLLEWYCIEMIEYGISKREFIWNHEVGCKGNTNQARDLLKVLSISKGETRPNLVDTRRNKQLKRKACFFLKVEVER